jgi:uncharacterized membrane protein
MAALTVWKFPSPVGAEAALTKLFLLSSDAVYDKVAAEFRGTDAELIQTNLSDEQDAQLREAFAYEG